MAERSREPSPRTRADCQRWYARRKAAHECVNCRKPLPDGWKIARCAECHERFKRRDSIRYATLKAQHRCVTCAEKLAKPYTFVRCIKCRVEVDGANPEKIAEKLRQPSESELERWLDAKINESVPRCRCGLALPCNGCLPSIAELASSRRGGPVYPEGAP